MSLTHSMNTCTTLALCLDGDIFSSDVKERMNDYFVRDMHNYLQLQVI